MKCSTYNELITISSSMGNKFKIDDYALYSYLRLGVVRNADEYKTICKFIDEYRDPGVISIDMVTRGYNAMELKRFYDMMIKEFSSRSLDMIKYHTIFGMAYESAILSSSKGDRFNLVIPDNELFFSVLKKILIRLSRTGAIIDDDVREFM